jgi:hypothetical protein
MAGGNFLFILSLPFLSTSPTSFLYARTSTQGNGCSWVTKLLDIYLGRFAPSAHRSIHNHPVYSIVLPSNSFISSSFLVLSLETYMP